MKYYHGTNNPNLKIEPHIKSRYGFSAFFSTPQKKLAIQYAYYNYLKCCAGYLYSFDFLFPVLEFDFKCNVSHSLVFRNLIFRLQKEGHDYVLIKNVIDYPSEKISDYRSYDVLIVFNLEKLPALKQIGKYNIEQNP